MENRNKIFNTTNGEAVCPIVVVGREHVVTVQNQVVCIRVTARRRRPIVGFVAYLVQRAVDVTVPGSGKEATTGLNVFADREIIPEHEYRLEYITNRKIYSLLAGC